jgi:hypothetical protein
MEYTVKTAIPHKMEYTIAAAHNYEELIAVVNDFMKKGWAPLGGPFLLSVTSDGMGMMLSVQSGGLGQALTRPRRT